MANSAYPDLDLHCLQRQGISGLSRTRVKTIAQKRLRSACPCMQSDQNLHYPHEGTLDPQLSKDITKTCLYNFDPLKPHFYIVKLGFTGVNIIFLISAQSIDCGYSLEPPRQGGSNEYPQSMF